MADLVIVESPGKTRKIGDILGSGYRVYASFGHVRDLPTSSNGRGSGGPWRPFDPEAPDVPGVRCSDWAADWQPIGDKREQIDKLVRAARAAGVVWLATDLDREGEAIAWHLREVIGGPAARFRRVTFSEITPAAIAAAFERPRALDEPLVDAQIARRLLDRVVGYTVSPLLAERLRQSGLSAGRVQSAALRLLADRDEQIRKFTAAPYWLVDLTLAAGGVEVVLRVVGPDGKPLRYATEQDAGAAARALGGAPVALTGVDSAEQRVRPAPPFTTSTLQQAASSRLRIGVDETMKLAQKLYEAGLITYMRSDAVSLSPEAQQAARAWIAANVGDHALPTELPVYRSKAGAQEAHEAVRVTDPARPRAEADAIGENAGRLYDLILRRFLASQMTPAVVRRTVWTAEADTPAGSVRLSATGRVVADPGWQVVLPPPRRRDDPPVLPDLPRGHRWPAGGAAAPLERWTKPPQRYTEAALVVELERRGVGRPATYAQTLNTLRQRLYVLDDRGAFTVTPLGRLVCEILSARFTNVCDVAFTARVEESLDLIAAGRMDYREFLAVMWKRLQGELRTAAADRTFLPPVPVPVELPCPSCSRPRSVKLIRRALVLACAARDCGVAELAWAPERVARSRSAAAEPDEADEADRQAAEQRRQRRCPRCGGTTGRWSVSTGGYIHLCEAWPRCAGAESVPPSAAGAKRARKAGRKTARKRASSSAGRSAAKAPRRRTAKR